MTQIEDQRLAALDKANEIRFRRAHLKRRLRSGQYAFVPLIRNPPEWAETMRVFDLLMALYKFGKVRWAKVARAANIRYSTTLGDLTDRQADLIVNELTELGYS